MLETPLATPSSSRPRLRPALGVHESVITIPGLAADSAEDFARRLTAAMPPGHAPLATFLFGRQAHLRTTLARLEAGPLRDSPILAVEGAPCHEGGLAGAQVYHAPACMVHRTRFDGRVVGSLFHDGSALHGVFAGLGPRHIAPGPEVEAAETFDTIARVLKHAGFGMPDIVRTWFYNHDILAWYDAFNRARATAYRDVSFELGAHPASTGIEATNPAGTALTTALWVTHRTDPESSLAALASPLQCPAPAYGSLFSRAAEIVSGGRQRIFVSGTASIAPGGETIWQDDAPRQIDQTMRVIAALLAPRGLGLADIDRATAYFKRPEDIGPFRTWLQAHDLDTMPFIAVHADVCRDDLLFELEADAVRAV